MKKTEKDTKAGSEKVLCNFGFELQPRCGAFVCRFNLTKTPELRELIRNETIPPYSYEFRGEDTVDLDQCLVCHLQKGFTPQEYERKNEQAGVTRENIPRLKETYPFIQDKVETQIKEDRRDLVKKGFSVDLDIKKNLCDS